jgi:endonuclease G, mitochondrial
MKLRTPVVIAFLVLLVILYQRFAHRAAGPSVPGPVAGPAPRDNDNLALGNPSNAVHSTSQPDNYLVTRPQFVLSYNRNKGGPNWVSWRLHEADLGSVERGNLFAPDPLLPEDWRIRPSDYQGAGYDRGHQCPSGDRTARPEDNEATFVMSNMLPQTGELNRDVWRELEEYCRDLAKEGQELYITCGGYGSQGSIGGGKVNVPTHCWKVIVTLPEGDNDLQRIDANTRVIAVDIPNAEGIENNPWQQYVTQIAAVERSSGYRFLTNLPEPVRQALETKSDSGSGSSHGSGHGSKRKRRRH